MQGDSGGPLICGKDKRKVSHSLVGVLQGGPFTRGKSKLYWSLYTHAPAYSRWIEAQAKKMQEEITKAKKNPRNKGQQMQTHIFITVLSIFL